MLKSFHKLQSSSDQYGSIAITIHWLTVAIVFLLIATGVRMEDLVNDLDKVEVLNAHAMFGGILLVITVFRIIWWKYLDNKPINVSMPNWQKRLAKIVHTGFYIVILGMIASGIGMLVMSSSIPIVLGKTAGELPDFWDYPPRVPHGIGAKIIMVLIVTHVAGALIHYYQTNSDYLKRMWY